MTDREKVIKYLQRMANIYDLNGDIQSMWTIDDAIFLLSNIKPIVTTNASRIKERGFLVMTNREKVVRGLEACVSDSRLMQCENCPYQTYKSRCVIKLMQDALALLKEQEARVLEYSEIEKHPLVWLEDNDKEDVIPALFLQYNGWSAEFVVQDPDKYVDAIVRSAMVSAVEGMYGMTWRAWTSRPTPEQMREVPWE